MMVFLFWLGDKYEQNECVIIKRDFNKMLIIFN